MPEHNEKYRSSSQQRILRVLVSLAGHEVSGIAPSELAKALSVTYDKMTRDLANLRIAGLAEPITDTNRWRLTPKLTQIGLAMLNNLERSQQKIDEVKQRYTRNPH